MLSPRLSRKLEGLSDEALGHIESQTDLLLTMAGRGQPDRRRAGLRLVSAPPAAPIERRIERLDAELAELTHIRQLLIRSRTALDHAQTALDHAQTAAQAAVERRSDAPPWMARLVANLDGLRTGLARVQSRGRR